MMFGDGFEQATILRATPTARQDSAQASSNPAMRKDVLLHGVPEQHPQRHGCAWLDSFVDGLQAMAPHKQASRRSMPKIV